jgi:hypothetical protein
MKNLFQKCILVGFSLLLLCTIKDAFSAGPLTPSGPPSATGTSLDELSHQVADLKTNIGVVQASLATPKSGIKRVIRGVVTGNDGATVTASFSPAVDVNKCQVFLGTIVTTLTGSLDSSIVTSLTSTSITIEFSNNAQSVTMKTGYEIVEYE